MGHGRWDSDITSIAYGDTVKYRSTLDSHTLRKQTFSNSLDKSLDPKNIVVRESRDSQDNPNSNAIIIGLDVTGSMGIIAEKMARGKLGDLMNGIFNRKPLVDPHVMVMAIGDAVYDKHPLQVSQFEADIRIDKSLQQLYLEGGGGGNHFESYDLPWFFAASRTSIDCFEKRGKKGYLFTIGDEMPPPSNNYMNKHMLERIFGKIQDIPESSDAALAAAQEKYNVFHVVVEQGSYARRDKEKVLNAWGQLLGRRAIRLDNWENVAEVILAAIELNEGKNVEDIIQSQQNESIKKSIEYSFGHL